MDPVGLVEDSDPRYGFGPKLIVTGRLEGTLMGRSVELEATGRQFLLRLADLRSAWRLRHAASTSMLPLLRILKANGVGLRVSSGSILTFEVLPEASLAVRLLVPSLNSI